MWPSPYATRAARSRSPPRMGTVLRDTRGIGHSPHDSAHTHRKGPCSLGLTEGTSGLVRAGLGPTQRRKPGAGAGYILGHARVGFSPSGSPAARSPGGGLRSTRHISDRTHDCRASSLVACMSPGPGSLYMHKGSLVATLDHSRPHIYAGCRCAQRRPRTLLRIRTRSRTSHSSYLHIAFEHVQGAAQRDQ